MTSITAVGVGINGKTVPSFALDVIGDINCTGNFKINGTNLSTGGGSVAWADVTSKPTTFTPSTHTHTTSDITGLDTALAGKQATLTAGTNINIVGNTISATSSQWVSGTSFIYYNGGNVGIGRTNPAYKLQVDGTFSSSDLTTPAILTNITPTSFTTLNDPKNVLILQRVGTSGQTNNANAVFKLCRYENNSTNARTRLDINLTHAMNDVEVNVMSLRSDGNVGIGKTDASKKLQVIDSTQGSISVVGTGDVRYHCYNNGSVQEWAWGQKSSSSHNWILSTLNSGNEVDRLTVATNGDIGIGKSPAYKLDVSGDANVSGVYRVNGVDIIATKFNTTDQYKLFNNMGVNHTSYQDFNSPPNYGFWFIQGTGNSPATNGATQYYCINQGLGNEYPWTGTGSYGIQIGIPRNVSNPYISIRYKENNVLGSWSKISAGQADTALQIVNPDKLNVDDMGTYRRIQSFGSTPLAINPLGNNVGIGKTNPEYPLDVNGVIKGTGLIINNFFIDIQSTHSAIQRKTAGSPLVLNPTNTNNVAIGKLTAGYKLDVVGDINMTGTLRKNGTDVLTYRYSITFTKSNFATNVWYNYLDLSSINSTFIFGQNLRMFELRFINSTDFGVGNIVFGKLNMRISDFAGLKWSNDSDTVLQNCSAFTVINYNQIRVTTTFSTTLQAYIISSV